MSRSTTSDINKIFLELIKPLYDVVSDANANASAINFENNIAKHPNLNTYKFSPIQLNFNSFKHHLLEDKSAPKQYLYHHFQFMVDVENNLTFLIRKTNNQNYSDKHSPKDAYYTINGGELIPLTTLNDVSFANLFQNNNAFETELNKIGFSPTKCIMHSKNSIQLLMASLLGATNIEMRFVLISDTLPASSDPLFLLSQYHNNRISFVMDIYNGSTKLVTLDIGHLQP